MEKITKEKSKYRQDLTGHKFGHLTVIGLADSQRYPSGHLYRRWKCECDCGRDIIVSISNIKRIKSCSVCSRKNTHKTHGLSTGNFKRIYNIWNLMQHRCNNPQNNKYDYYGGKGIKVCDEWNDVRNFVNWSLVNGYNDNLTIDRIDGNGNYEPSNCRWVDLETQHNNTKKNHYITYNGETLSISQWCRRLGLDIAVIRNRIRRGWDETKALTCQVLKNSESQRKVVLQYTLDGEFVAKYESTKIAAISLDVNKSSVANCCRGILKTLKGFKFKYEN